METLIDAFVREGLRGMADTTTKTYRHGLIQFEQYLATSEGTLETLTQFDVQAYIKHLQTEKKAPATINKVFATIQKFAQWTSQEHALIDIRLPKLAKTSPKSIERTDRNKLFRDVQKDGNDRNIAIVYLLYFTGLRVSELTSLNIEDIEISERKGVTTVTGKGNKHREVPIDSRARTFIQRYLDSRTDDNEALFVSQRVRNGKVSRLSTRQIERIVEPYGIHPHMLRHTFARDLLDAGEDHVTVATLLGHSGLHTIVRYTEPTAARKELAVSKLGQ